MKRKHESPPSSSYHKDYNELIDLKDYLENNPKLTSSTKQNLSRDFSEILIHLEPFFTSLDSEQHASFYTEVKDPIQKLLNLVHAIACIFERLGTYLKKWPFKIDMDPLLITIDKPFLTNKMISQFLHDLGLLAQRLKPLTLFGNKKIIQFLDNIFTSEDLYSAMGSLICLSKKKILTSEIPVDDLERPFNSVLGKDWTFLTVYCLIRLKAFTECHQTRGIFVLKNLELQSLQNASNKLINESINALTPLVRNPDKFRLTIYGAQAEELLNKILLNPNDLKSGYIRGFFIFLNDCTYYKKQLYGKMHTQVLENALNLLLELKSKKPCSRNIKIAFSMLRGFAHCDMLTTPFNLQEIINTFLENSPTEEEMTSVLISLKMMAEKNLIKEGEELLTQVIYTISTQDFSWPALKKIIGLPTLIHNKKVYTDEAFFNLIQKSLQVFNKKEISILLNRVIAHKHNKALEFLFDELATCLNKHWSYSLEKLVLNHYSNLDKSCPLAEMLKNLILKNNSKIPQITTSIPNATNIPNEYNSYHFFQQVVTPNIKNNSLVPKFTTL
jgi:hypothetical protein